MPKRIYDHDTLAAHIIKLQRSLYDLMDEANIWYEVTANKLEKGDLNDVKSSPCIFRNEKAIVVCYVDDLLVFTKDMVYFEYQKSQLKKELNTKDFGEPKQFLGM